MVHTFISLVMDSPPGYLTDQLAQIGILNSYLDLFLRFNFYAKFLFFWFFTLFLPAICTPSPPQSFSMYKNYLLKPSIKVIDFSKEPSEKSCVNIFRPFLANFTPSTLISFTKLRFRRSFWGAEWVWTSIGSKVMP